MPTLPSRFASQKQLSIPPRLRFRPNPPAKRKRRKCHHWSTEYSGELPLVAVYLIVIPPHLPFDDFSTILHHRPASSFDDFPTILHHRPTSYSPPASPSTTSQPSFITGRRVSWPFTGPASEFTWRPGVKYSFCRCGCHSGHSAFNLEPARLSGHPALALGSPITDLDCNRSCLQLHGRGILSSATPSKLAYYRKSEGALSIVAVPGRYQEAIKKLPGSHHTKHLAHLSINFT